MYIWGNGIYIHDINILLGFEKSNLAVIYTETSTSRSIEVSFFSVNASYLSDINQLKELLTLFQKWVSNDMNKRKASRAGS